jgi:hypothetical protein
VFVWHEAADVTVFHPPKGAVGPAGPRLDRQLGRRRAHGRDRGLPARSRRDAGLPLDIHGVRYPEAAKALLARYGATYRGWLANAAVPGAFARHLATVHVPRRFYVETLPGIPTIRVFEALACGIPLVSAPWRDVEGLFRSGEDYLVGHDRASMTAHSARARQRSRPADQPRRLGPRDHPRPPHLRPSRRRTAVDPRPDRRRAPPGERRMKIAFYGSSLLSSYWNGAATYYRGLLRELAGRGHDIVFYEPDAFDRQKHRDIDPPDWAQVVVYEATDEAVDYVINEAAFADVVVKASGVGRVRRSSDHG